VLGRAESIGCSGHHLTQRRARTGGRALGRELCSARHNAAQSVRPQSWIHPFHAPSATANAERTLAARGCQWPRVPLGLCCLAGALVEIARSSAVLRRTDILWYILVAGFGILHYSSDAAVVATQ
jgi:hypothetical protein